MPERELNPFNEFSDEENPHDNSASTWTQDGKFVFGELKYLRRVNKYQLTQLNTIQKILLQNAIERQTYRKLWTFVVSVLGVVVALLEIIKHFSK